jgi:hypothetical protein
MAPKGTLKKVSHAKRILPWFAENTDASRKEIIVKAVIVFMLSYLLLQTIYVVTLIESSIHTYY